MPKAINERTGNCGKDNHKENETPKSKVGSTGIVGRFIEGMDKA